eukprot:5314995-Alexandrium_andersonii.AAC.1
MITCVLLSSLELSGALCVSLRSPLGFFCAIQGDPRGAQTSPGGPRTIQDNSKRANAGSSGKLQGKASDSYG